MMCLKWYILFRQSHSVSHVSVSHAVKLFSAVITHIWHTHLAHHASKSEKNKFHHKASSIKVIVKLFHLKTWLTEISFGTHQCILVESLSKIIQFWIVVLLISMMLGFHKKLSLCLYSILWQIADIIIKDVSF